MFTVNFEQRDFSGRRLTPGLACEVERLHWRAVGGPWRARVRVEAADLERLWQAAELLRCGVTVYDGLGAAWWGYVHAVDIVNGAQTARLDLGAMANDVMVRYKTLSPDPWGGEDAWTSAAVDTASIAEYGRKAAVYALGPATEAQAQAARDTWLARHALPALATKAAAAGAGSVTRPYAVLECRGWWDTLDWLFYADSRGNEGNKASGTGMGLGHSASFTKWAQSFTVGAEMWSVSEVWVRLYKQGLPTDNLRLELCANSGGAPGAALAAVELPAAAVSNEWTWVRFPLASTVGLGANGTYWITLSRSGAVNSGAYYVISSDLKLGYPGGVLRSWNGTTWAAYGQDGDLSFVVCGVVDQGAILTHMLGNGSAGCGQFLAGARLEDDPGFEGIPTRDGRSRGRVEVEAALKQGTAAGRRLLARVESDRWARVYAQPESGKAELVVLPSGVLGWRSGRRLLPSEQAAGRWALLGVLSSTGRGSEVFVEACAWDQARRLHVEEED